jgi:hypothetical protein
MSVSASVVQRFLFIKCSWFYFIIFYLVTFAGISNKRITYKLKRVQDWMLLLEKLVESERKLVLQQQQHDQCSIISRIHIA